MNLRNCFDYSLFHFSVVNLLHKFWVLCTSGLVVTCTFSVEPFTGYIYLVCLDTINLSVLTQRNTIIETSHSVELRNKKHGDHLCQLLVLDACVPCWFFCWDIPWLPCLRHLACLCEVAWSNRDQFFMCLCPRWFDACTVVCKLVADCSIPLFLMVMIYWLHKCGDRSLYSRSQLSKLEYAIQWSKVFSRHLLEGYLMILHLMCYQLCTLQWLW